MAHPEEAWNIEWVEDIGYVLAKDLIAVAQIMRDIPKFDGLRENAFVGRQWNDLLRKVGPGRAHVIWGRIKAHPEEGWSNEWVEEIGYVLAKELIAAARELQKDSTAQRRLIDLLAFRVGVGKAAFIGGKLLAHPQEKWVELAAEMGVILSDEQVAFLMEPPPAPPNGVKSHSQPLDVQPKNPPDPAQDYVARQGKTPGLSDQTARYQPVAVSMPDPAKEKSSAFEKFAPRADDGRDVMVGISHSSLFSDKNIGRTLVETLIDDLSPLE